MGDRANVYVKDDSNAGVFLYTHWGGSELALSVQTTLKRARERWNDGPYLARAIFSDMISGDTEGLTGYGISARLCDNEHSIITIDPDALMVGFAPEPKGNELPEPLRSWSFAEFIALAPDDVQIAYGAELEAK